MHKKLKKILNQEDLPKQLVIFFIIEKLAREICNEFCYVRRKLAKNFGFGRKLATNFGFPGIFATKRWLVLN